MDNQLHNELRKEIQPERMFLFSDAILAIAIIVPVIFIIFSFVYIRSPVIAALIPIMIPVILKIAFDPMKKKIIKQEKSKKP